MQAIILAGGAGTRLRPLTQTLPKPMLPVLNRPFLEHLLESLRNHGFNEVFLTTSFLPTPIQEYFGDGTRIGLTLHYTHEPQPMGTAGAVKLAAPYLRGTFLVCNGDIFTNLDIEEMLSFHIRQKAMATIFLTAVENPSAFGVVDIDKIGRIKRFIEKPKPDQITSCWINGGFYFLEPEILREVPENTYFMFERGLFPRLLDLDYPVYGYQAKPYWLDMGTPKTYLKLNRDLLSQSHLTDPPHSLYSYGVWQGSGCHVAKSAQVKGPILIGEDSKIAKGALVVGPSILGPGCQVETMAVVIRSIIWANSTIGKNATVEECIIGKNVRIGREAHISRGCVIADESVIGDGCWLGEDSSVGPREILVPHTDHPGPKGVRTRPPIP